ncbi:MAG: translation initiation factor IF-1 [Longimicrobiales bacterium]
MAKQTFVEMTGMVREALPSMMYRVEMENGHNVLATLAGRAKRRRVRVLVGDRVKLEVSPYDLRRGRIVYGYSN